MNDACIPSAVAALDPDAPRAFPAVQAQPSAFTALITSAVERGMGIDLITQLIDLHERHEASEARKAFNAAVAAFKRCPPTITKDKQVRYPGKDGKPSTNYRHATLGQVTEKLGEALGAVGLSLRWNVQQGNGSVSVTCILAHELGHTETVTMSGPHDQSGGKNAIQAIASTVTYLERHTAIAITGVAVSDEEDDDGAGGASGGVQQPRRTAEQWERGEQQDTRRPAPEQPARRPEQPARRPEQPARRPEAAPAQAAPVVTNADAPVLISTSAARMLRSKLGATGRAEAECCAHFGLASIDALPMARVNEALKWAAA